MEFPFEVLGSFTEGAVYVQHCQFPEIFFMHSKLSTRNIEIKPGHDLSPVAKVYCQVKDAKDTLHEEGNEEVLILCLILTLECSCRELLLLVLPHRSACIFI